MKTTSELLYGVSNKHILDFHFPSMKTAVFVDKTIKMSILSIKRGVFVDEVRDICYICMI
jgi:hypothetical protein